MSELMKIIDEWKDRNGNPPDSSIARAIGVAPQTVDSWRNRGMKTIPRNLAPLRNLAEFFGVSYDDVIAAAVAVDVGLRDEMPEFQWPERRGRGTA